MLLKIYKISHYLLCYQEGEIILCFKKKKKDGRCLNKRLVRTAKQVDFVCSKNYSESKTLHQCSVLTQISTKRECRKEMLCNFGLGLLQTGILSSSLWKLGYSFWMQPAVKFTK